MKGQMLTLDASLALIAAAIFMLLYASTMPPRYSNEQTLRLERANADITQAFYRDPSLAPKFVAALSTRGYLNESELSAANTTLRQYATALSLKRIELEADGSFSIATNAFPDIPPVEKRSSYMLLPVSNGTSNIVVRISVWN